MIPCTLTGLSGKGGVRTADARLQQRYRALVMAQLSHAHRVACGVKPPASLANPFAAVQAAWRFYGNKKLSLPQLAEPLLECAREDVPQLCGQWLLVALDWSNLHLGRHDQRQDRIELAHGGDLGYKLLTALAISDGTGAPIAPLCLEMEASDGVHSTRVGSLLRPVVDLDALQPVMRQIQQPSLGKTPVFIIDREGDSVGHFRDWAAAGHRFLVRANDKPRVVHAGVQQPLGAVADGLRQGKALRQVRSVEHHGKRAPQFVAETSVQIRRPAQRNRVEATTGKSRCQKIKGVDLELRLIVSEIRDEAQVVLARWLVLSNVPASVPAEQIALWYYWRWRIESYHKLLKSAGQQVESWQQETAGAYARRLLVAAMACVVVWRLAREQGEAAEKMREVLVRLSGRQMKRGPGQRRFTEPALLAGLTVLLPMLELLRSYSSEQIRELVQKAMPGLLSLEKPGAARRSPPTRSPQRDDV